MQVRRLPAGRAWHTLGPDWRGETAVIVGNGTSMVDVNLSVCKQPGVRVLVTNGGWRLFRRADVLMCSDRHWLRDHGMEVRHFLGTEIIVTQPQAIPVFDRRMRFMRRAFIEHVAPESYFANPALLVEGHTSITTNMSVAVHRGVRRILLVGIDLAPGADGRRRATENITDNPTLAAQRYEKQAKWFRMLAPWIERAGIEVVNCSPRSILTCWRYSTIEVELARTD
jgi:hypothetical protein